MSSKFVILLFISVASSEITAPGIDRSYSDGVKSVGYSVVYGDEDMTIINQAVSDAEKSSMLKSRVNLNEAIAPLPSQDVKCLMSVDRYCSKEMLQTKGLLIQALKNNCEKCTQKEKEVAGRTIASMMAHDSVAWKMFLTRSALLSIPRKKRVKIEDVKLKTKGRPEEITSKSKFTLPGFNVRVKRHAAVKI
ncbi:uncharacterized protein LOC114243296 [Bombyx mandarina]|uniref:Uncharacterized protein LOC114243296 n=1 Tax=Bombyx mandarina TaxID=7092 RepID=A0A6J2JND4_BOMMA|nr:uncharacterized protein LOC114243296 [Bombyx mandarina]